MLTTMILVFLITALVVFQFVRLYAIAHEIRADIRFYLSISLGASSWFTYVLYLLKFSQ